MKMYRLTAILLVIVLILSTVACGNNAPAETTPETTSETVAETSEETSAETEPEALPETKAEESEAPETKTPETEAPETKVPETKAPETKAPETKAPETKAPETKAPETKAPETKAPETKAPETKAPETKAPETKAPETKAPETKAPETKAPETKVPETKAPETVPQDDHLSKKTTVVAPTADTTVKETGTILYLKSGAKSGDGSQSKPYGTPNEVLAAIKKLSPDSKRSVVVKVSAGEYELTEPMTINGNDFAAYASSITFLCSDNSPAVFAAWTKITGWSETKVNGKTAWQATLPKGLDPRQFFSKDGERMTRPRLPETGFYTVTGVPGVDKPFQRSSPWSLNCDMAFNYEKGLLPTFSQVDQIELRIPHYWVEEYIKIDSVDYSNSVVHMKTASSIALAESGYVGSRYYLDNVFEALDHPGEVYADIKAGKIYYIPKSGENMNSFYLYASAFDNILSVENLRGSEGNYALTFKNIAFVGTDHPDTPLTGKQGATDAPGTVVLNHSSYVRFLGCRFEHLGGYAVAIPDDCDHITIDHCDLRDLGAGGVHITGSYKPSVYDVLVSDCIIEDFGKVYAAGVGVLIRFAHDCYITHNTIRNGYSPAISLGWLWGLNMNSVTGNILVEKNHIYNIGLGYISDIGAVYTLGPQEGTVIRQNLIHDVKAYEKGYGGSGIYPDEGSSHMIFEDNIVYNTMDSCYSIHYGQNNIVRNNIFAFSNTACFNVQKVDNSQSKPSAIVTNNILISDGRPAYANIPGSNFWIEDDSNLYWNISGDVFCGTGGTRAQRYSPTKMQQNKLFKNAVVADPQFVDAKNRNFTLKAGSPASTIGFRPLDLSDAGARR